MGGRCSAGRPGHRRVGGQATGASQVIGRVGDITVVSATSLRAGPSGAWTSDLASPPAAQRRINSTPPWPAVRRRGRATTSRSAWARSLIWPAATATLLPSSRGGVAALRAADGPRPRVRPFPAGQRHPGRAQRRDIARRKPGDRPVLRPSPASSPWILPVPADAGPGGVTSV